MHPSTSKPPGNLSRPRLFKARRHFSSSRVRPASAASPDTSGAEDWFRAFNPFKTSGGLGFGDNGAAVNGVDEKIQKSRPPFNPRGATRVPGNGEFAFGGGGGKDFDLGRFGSDLAGSSFGGGYFVFGNGGKENRSSTRSSVMVSGSAGPSVSSGSGSSFVFSAGSGSNVTAGNSQSGNKVFGKSDAGVERRSADLLGSRGDDTGFSAGTRGASSFASERIGSFRTSAIRSSVQDTSTMSSSTGAKSETAGFGCSASFSVQTTSATTSSRAGEKFGSAGSQGSLGAQSSGSSSASGTSFFLPQELGSSHGSKFFSNVRTGNRNSSSSCNDTVLSDKMLNLDQKHSDLGDGLEEIKQSYESGSPRKEFVFVLGPSSKSARHSRTTISAKLPEALNKLNIGIGVTSEKITNETVDNAPRVFRPAEKLPEAMTKLNIGPETLSEKSKNVNVVHTTDFSGRNSFAYAPSEKLPEVMNKSNIGYDPARENMENEYAKFMTSDSIFETDEIKCFTFGQPPTFSSTRTADSVFGPAEKLPEAMIKLNIGTETLSENLKNVNDIHTTNFSGPSLFAYIPAEKPPEVTNKLNIDNDMARENMESECSKFKASDSIFGSDGNKCFTFGQPSTSSFAGSGKNSFQFVQKQQQKLRNEDSKIGASCSQTNDSCCNCNVGATDMPERPLFRSKNMEDGSVQPNATNKIQKEMKKLNVQDENEIPSSYFEKSNNSTMHTFSFQGNIHNQNSTRSRNGQETVRENAANISTVELPLPDNYQEFVEPTFTSARMHENSEILKTPVLSRENLFTEFGKPVTSRATKSKKIKKKSDKSRRSSLPSQNFSQSFASGIKYSENLETESPLYSPMDYSPYRADQVAQSSREASIASEDSNHILHGVSTNMENSACVDENDLISATQSFKIGGNDVIVGEQKEKNVKDGSEKDSTVNFSLQNEPFSITINEDFVEKDDNGDPNHESGDAIRKRATSPFSSDIDIQAGGNGTSFEFNLDGFDGCNFSLGASYVAQGSSTSSKRRHRKKNVAKGCGGLHNSTLRSFDPLASLSTDSLPATSSVVHDLQGNLQSVPMSVDGNQSEKKRNLETRKLPIPFNAAKTEEQEACDKWRLRGNQAYAKGKMSKAEEYYSRGIDSITKCEVSRSSHTLMLCYSNRAAARMSLGRMREALGDCKMALSIDSNFLRARLRAANCFLVLGEIEGAIKYFKMCLNSHTDISQDEKIIAEATAGMKKSQQVANYIAQSVELLLMKTPKEVAKALEMIKEALLISPNSEELLEKKASALLMLRSYHEVVQLCQQTLESAMANSVQSGVNLSFESIKDSNGMKFCEVRIWRWHHTSLSYFYLGKLEEALELLRKLDQVKPEADKHGFSDSSSLLVTTAELLRLKASGNEAFQAGKHMEAVEHYTAAVTCSTESRPFAAVCFCNRAAAFQALGQIADAIADCSLAIALDPNYAKALSRRATLYEMIRDYEQAAADLLRLISILENQLKDKGKESGLPGRSPNNSSELNRTHMRLSAVEKEARREVCLDLYMILGVELSCSAADVKKAYRKAALRHHPDKAGQLLPRSENINDVIWKELYDEVHRDADRLFKMIGEAYSVLSDPAKRLQYDEEEEIRTIIQKDYNKTNKFKTRYNDYNTYDRKHHWRTYESSHRYRSEYSRSGRW